MTFVVFQGSMSIRDWINNSQFRLRNGVHTGFHEQMLWCENVIPHQLRSLDSDDPIFCVGHSLGGALAVLMARAMKERGRTYVQVCTFGCPRIGDEEFMHRVAVPAIHVVNANDIVPTLPSKKRGYADNPGVRVQMGKVPIWGKLFGSVKAHDPRKYLESIERMKEPI